MDKISSNDFLEFAKEDFKQGGDRGRVNTYGNLKRSLHAQIDKLLEHFELSVKKSFPDKFDLINKLNLISPRSFKELNNTRNILEHEYMLPNKDKDELWIDLVELYLQNTNSVLNSVIKYSDKWKKHLKEVYDQLPEYAKRSVSIHIKTKDLELHLDSSDYPKMFIETNAFNGLLVIGDDAPPAHVIAITDIAMGLKNAHIEDVDLQDIKKIEIGQAVLASEVKDPTCCNIISLGNPDINPVTAEIMGLEFGTKFEFDKNTAIIKFYQSDKSKIALIIIGYDDEAIISAAKVLANYQDYEITGSEVIVAKG